MPIPKNQERDLVRWKWVLRTFAFLVFLPACGTAANPAPEPTTTPVLASPTAATYSDVTAASAQVNASPESYGVLVRRVFSTVADLTRILSDVSIQLGAAPESALQAADTVNATKGTFEFVRDQLALTSPPPGHEELHRLLVDALEFYAAASAALLPDAETKVADYWRFQGLMQEGGKNFHAAGAEFDKLRP